MTSEKEKDGKMKEAAKTAVDSTKPIEDTQKEKSDFWENISEVTGKGTELFKMGVEKVGHFTSSSAKFAKLKVEIHNLKNEQEKLNLEAGQKLWQMFKDNKLSNVEAAFSNTFKEMDILRKQIATKEKQVAKISLIE